MIKQTSIIKFKSVRDSYTYEILNDKKLILMDRFKKGYYFILVIEDSNRDYEIRYEILLKDEHNSPTQKDTIRNVIRYLHKNRQLITNEIKRSFSIDVESYVFDINEKSVIS